MSLAAVSSSSALFSPYPATAEGKAAVRPDSAGRGRGSDGKPLDESQQAQVEKLKERDRQVRQHEQAHLAAAGGLAKSAASYSYQKGPDGVNYAVGGEVDIDTSPGQTPEETLSKARQIRAAALAPADPSPQDRAVAAQAAQMEMQARMEQAQQSSSASEEGGGERASAQSDQSGPRNNPVRVSESGAAVASVPYPDASREGSRMPAAISIYRQMQQLPGMSGTAGGMVEAGAERGGFHAQA